MKPTILIADDDQDLLEVMRQFFENNGFRVFTASSGLEAVSVAGEEKIDILLLDWDMPMGNGAGVIEMLAEKESTRDIPIVVLSGIRIKAMTKTAFALGVKACLEKPCDNDILLTTVRSLLKK